tara:strand:- start:11920 stop:12258 length:339 start_codon:yes stop_codon:yes gene_type:complete
MKYVENYTSKHDNKNSDKKSYNAFGESVTDTEDIVYAEYKAIDLGERVQKKFFVLTSNGTLFDPRGTDSHRANKIRKELKSTSKQTFDYYIKYLQTKNTLFMRRAERSFING